MCRSFNTKFPNFSTKYDHEELPDDWVTNATEIRETGREVWTND